MDRTADLQHGVWLRPAEVDPVLLEPRGGQLRTVFGQQLLLLEDNIESPLGIHLFYGSLHDLGPRLSEELVGVLLDGDCDFVEGVGLVGEDVRVVAGEGEGAVGAGLAVAGAEGASPAGIDGLVMIFGHLIKKVYN